MIVACTCGQDTHWCPSPFFQNTDCFWQIENISSSCYFASFYAWLSDLNTINTIKQYFLSIRSYWYMHSCKKSVFCKKGEGHQKVPCPHVHFCTCGSSWNITHLALNSNLTTHSQVSIGNTSTITFDIYKYLMVNFRSRTTLFYGTRENVYVKDNSDLFIQIQK